MSGTKRARAGQTGPWRPVEVGGVTLELLNLDHPDIASLILEEMGTGFSVYYDNRWGVTRRLCTLLMETPELTQGKRVLVLGAGVGAEVVAAGLHAGELHLNDLSPLALDLSVRQLERNGVDPASVFLHPGDFSTIPLPDADLAVACYVVYDQGTQQAMSRFLERFAGPVLVVNGDMPPMRRLLRETDREQRPVSGLEDLPAAWLAPRPNTGGGISPATTPR